MEKGTISFGPEKHMLVDTLLDEIQKTGLLRIHKTEDILLWSLAVAKLFLEAWKKSVASSAPEGVPVRFDIVGIEPVIARSPSVDSPFGKPGIEPVPAPSPAVRILFEMLQKGPEPAAFDLELPDLLSH